MASSSGDADVRTTPHDIMAGVDHWQRLVRGWSLLGPPLRPSPADVAFVAARIAGVTRGLVLGVTPELVALPWPQRVVAVERDRAMIAGLYRGQWVVAGDWRALPLADRSIDLACGDGCLDGAPRPRRLRGDRPRARARARPRWARRAARVRVAGGARAARRDRREPGRQLPRAQVAARDGARRARRRRRRQARVRRAVPRPRRARRAHRLGPGGDRQRSTRTPARPRSTASRCWRVRARRSRPRCA